MKPFFSAQDFKFPSFHGFEDDIVALANDKLEREAKVVYGRSDYDAWYLTPEQLVYPPETQALLINIQPIDKKCVKHHPVWTSDVSFSSGKISPDFFGNPYCNNCGVELVAEWKAK
jgi:hypothetical protein